MCKIMRNNTKIRIVLFLLLFGIFIAGCENKEEYIDFSRTGSINGCITRVYHEFGGEVTKENVKVEIIGTDISTMTDEEGRFSLTNVPTGTYDIKFSRKDLADYEYHNVEIIGGDVPVVIKQKIKVFEAGGYHVEEGLNLIQKSTTEIKDIRVWKEDNKVCFKAEVTPNDEFNRKVVFWVSKGKNIYPKLSFHGNEEYIEHVEYYSNYSCASIDIDDKWYSDTIYVKAYGCSNNWGILEYRDRETGQVVFPGIDYENATETRQIIFTENK